MPSGQMQYDQENNNLVQQIKELQERIDQLERYALTSQNIKANNILVGDGSWSMDDLSSIANFIMQSNEGLSFRLDVGANSIGQFILSRDSLARWVIRMNYTAETGSDQGSDFELISRDDAGGYKDTPLKIFRGSGSISQNRTYFEGDYVSESQRVEDSLDNSHTGWTEHFDGSFYPASGWFWAGSPFIGTPGAVNESYSRLFLTLDRLTAGNRAFYYYTTPIPTSKTILPYFYNSATPLFVGWRWDDASDNNFVEVGWRSTVDGSSLPVFDGLIRSRTGGGSTVETQLTPFIPAGVKLQPLKANVEGTQWSNWTMRPFIAGLYQFRWLNAHSSKTWTPARFGLIFYNQSASSASYMSLGFDAFD